VKTPGGLESKRIQALFSFSGRKTLSERQGNSELEIMEIHRKVSGAAQGKSK
jgi:hypothetical protein